MELKFPDVDSRQQVFNGSENRETLSFPGGSRILSGWQGLMLLLAGLLSQWQGGSGQNPKVIS
ncbi:MAG TPA: hypothetical protein DGU45_07520 [Planctomycetes bacterium]|nr:hypothetical protein [Planctomycetota bacterium]